ncbi:MAG: aminodeoxychorismate/anthranilate synthase component II [Actinomycetota bacterium]|nr:aminodeoxychorismate/anthranilate synthase component II [Actinomycetota bacterium]
MKSLVKNKNMVEKIDILMIDNYDSFTYNLVQYLGTLGQNIKVARNDKITLKQIESLAPARIVISPGPGRPADGGISKQVIEKFYQTIPILGVCLGHQCIGEVFGARVINSGIVVHGKTSLIHHDGLTVFNHIDNPFPAARYHSLVLEPDTIAEPLTVSARTREGVVMGIRHKQYPLEGIQFHPESFLTGRGMKILKNFLEL